MRSKSSTGHYVETTCGQASVQAFVPGPLPPKLAPHALRDLSDALGEVEAALDRLQIVTQAVSQPWLAELFLRKEALLSSAIEGIQVTLEDLLAYEQTGRVLASHIADAEDVANFVKAIDHGFSKLDARRGLPLSIRLLNECHRQLMQGARNKDKMPGELRRTQVWIGGSHPESAVFVPPPHEHVSESLGRLERYIHQGHDLPPLLRVAAVHVQFETIHPYLDGNGRIGRMLITLLFAHWNILAKPLLYLSVYLKSHQQSYYDHLNAVRVRGDWIGWFRFFLDGVEKIADDAASTASKLHDRVAVDRKKLLATDSITVSAIQLFELLPGHPVISMPLVTELLETTKPTAGKAIELLQQSGVLTEIGKRKRDRLYCYERYLAILK